MIDHHRHYPAETAAEGHLRRFLHKHAPSLAATHQQRTADEQRAREATRPTSSVQKIAPATRTRPGADHEE